MPIFEEVLFFKLCTKTKKQKTEKRTTDSTSLVSGGRKRARDLLTVNFMSIFFRGGVSLFLYLLLYFVQLDVFSRAGQRRVPQKLRGIHCCAVALFFFKASIPHWLILLFKSRCL